MAARPNSKPAPPPIDSPDRRRLPPLLRRAWYGLNQAFRRRIAGTGATPDQFTALRCLTEADAQGITQGELTKLMSSDPNTIASLVERMEAAGWIERLPHEKDRRAYRIRVKPDGKRLYKQLRELALGLQASVLTVLPEGEREAFLTQLAAVADACREAAEQSPKRGK
ncbi:MAG: Multiple antibiotic resistance protein MarR [Verrucomicrobiota bacterium]